MSPPTQQRVWILANPPEAEIQPDTFKLETRPLPELKEGQLLVKADFFSNDPAQRGWMQKDADEERAYLPPIKQGEVVRTSGIATVVESKSSKWKKGQRVYGYFGWYDYAVVHEAAIVSPAVDLPGLPTASLSVLGMVSVTAYQGIFEVLKLKAEDTVVISGAAGAVGSMAIQLAKHVVGAKRVVGIAGGKEKCDWVVNYLGADACVDYKAHKGDDLREAIRKALDGDFANKYFDNVGGDILNTMFTLVARHGKIGICGMISGYNGASPDLSNIFEVIKNRLHIEGFLVLDMAPKYAEAVGNLAKWVKEGKIKTDQAETLVPTNIEGVPDVWQKLFKGENRGKLVTELSPSSKL